ncbi:MAG: hypothetical protein J6R41_07020 [Paludibacteraceae bacterium]|nr:hypothetical protein [Paludibacteraceae bacterium]
MMSCCCDFKEVLFAVLDWCGEHDALVAAVAGFISSAVIAKITSGMDLRRTLCVRRFEAYEKAITFLSLKLNVYNNILAAFESLKDAEVPIEVVKSKVVLLVATFQKLGEVEKEDSNVTGVALYTVFPPYDARPLVKELACFLSRLQDFSCLANLPDSQELLRQSANGLRGDVERILPMIENETNYLQTIYTQLKDEISKDKMAKKLFRRPKTLIARFRSWFPTKK